MGKWEVKSIGDIVDLTQGLAINSKTNQLIVEGTNGLPLLRIKDLQENSEEIYINKYEVPKKCIANKDELIFTRTGIVGLVFMNRFGVVHNNCFKISPKNDSVFTPFLYHYFRRKTLQEHLTNIAAGSVQPDLTHKIFNTYELEIPPLPEQKAIASVLSSLDDKIDLLHRQNKTLESMAETLFRQWFIEEADDSWEVKKITDLFEVRDGTHDSPKQKEIGKPLLTSRHLLDHKLDFENAYLISEEDYENVNKRSKVATNDILFSMIGTIGLIYLEKAKEINYAIKNIGLFKTSQNPAWAYFTYLWLKSDLGKDFIFQNRSGSTQEYISLGSLRDISFYYPTDKRINDFNSNVQYLFEKVYTNQKQIQTIEKLRDTLLPKLMSGEVRVKY